MESPLPPDPYAALGVPKNADCATIKSTYRKLALKYHPDKVSDEAKKAEATEKFHIIQQAYDIIGDEAKRAKYDAQVRLAELRRQNLELRNQMGPRVEVRTAGYDVRTAAPPYASFTARGPSRVYTDERRPSYFDEEPPRASSRKYDFAYVKRTSPKEEKEKRERVHVSDQDRKRAERRREREADVRESRDRKYNDAYVDEAFARYESDRRQRDKEEEARRKEAETRRKEDGAPRRPPLRREEMYEEDRKAQDAKRYMASQNPNSSSREARPGVFRRTSTSGYTYRRATAAPEKEHRSPRGSPPREPSPSNAAPKKSENVDPYDRRPPTLQTQNSAPSKVPATPHETKASKESRKAPPLPPHRAYTTQTDFDGRKEHVDENEPSIGNLPRPHTFHDEPVSTPHTAKKTEARVPPKTAPQPDSGYSSGSAPDGQYTQYPPPPPQPQTTTTTYVYPKDTPSGNTTPLAEAGNKFDKYPTSGYRVEVREPGASSRRVPSPHREKEAKPSSTATKMAHLASSRPHASTGSRSSPYAAYPEVSSSRPSMMPQSSSNRSIPRGSRSPERVSSSDRVRGRDKERERDRLYEYDRGRDRGRDVEREMYRDDRRREKLYGEMGPGYIRHTQANSGSFVGDDGVSYSRRVRPENIVYSTGGSRGSRERFYDDRRPAPPSFSRSTTMPVYAN